MPPDRGMFRPDSTAVWIVTVCTCTRVSDGKLDQLDSIDCAEAAFLAALAPFVRFV